MPSRNSLADLYKKMLGLIKDNKTQMNDSFRKLLSDYEEAIPIGVA
jgi:hypothetical protein